LRFLGVFVVGWIGVRVAMLWPMVEELPDAIALADVRPVARPERVQRPSDAAASLRKEAFRAGLVSAGSSPAVSGPIVTRRLVRPGSYVEGPVSAMSPIAWPVPEGHLVLPQMVTVAEFAPVSLWPSPLSTATAGADRVSASAWLVARPGTGLGAAPGGGQIGGSQAGARVVALLSRRQHVVAFGRVSAPLRDSGSEAALGVEWQPTPMPVRVGIERRVPLNGGRGGTGIGMVGGYDSSGRWGLEVASYAQAGIVLRERSEPYADGALRVTHGVARNGKLRLSLGVGSWGAAQRDAQRLDVGPSAVLSLPVAGQPIRIALDWRQRVAGGARPGSGPALSMGGDF
jgi:hypothetical protein